MLYHWKPITPAADPGSAVAIITGSQQSSDSVCVHCIMHGGQNNQVWHKEDEDNVLVDTVQYSSDRSMTWHGRWF